MRYSTAVAVAMALATLAVPAVSTACSVVAPEWQRGKSEAEIRRIELANAQRETRARYRRTWTADDVAQLILPTIAPPFYSSIEPDTDCMENVRGGWMEDAAAPADFIVTMQREHGVPRDVLQIHIGELARQREACNSEIRRALVHRLERDVSPSSLRRAWFYLVPRLAFYIPADGTTDRLFHSWLTRWDGQRIVFRPMTAKMSDWLMGTHADVREDAWTYLAHNRDGQAVMVVVNQFATDYILPANGDLAQLCPRSHAEIQAYIASLRRLPAAD